jgi:hypothetical protein
MLKVSTPAHPFTAEEVQSHLGKNVEGKQVAFENKSIARFTDWLRVSKAYKLNFGGGGGVSGQGSKKRKVENGHGMEEVDVDSIKEEDITELEMRILGAVALRGFS